jgi:glycosyltransferase involved in cell wall biosynthesis
MTSIKKDMVSVILPTSNRYEVALENIKNILEQSYKMIEVIVCDDSDKDYFEKNSESFRQKLDKNRCKYVYCARFDANGKKDYGLARSRNFGVIESEGEYLVFLDDRITPAEPNAISIFVSSLKPSKEKIWVFGDKGANKTSFVENFSAIRRSHIVVAGMFCERVDQYGGMTREIISRYTNQGFKFKYVPEAKGKQVCKSRGWDKKPEQISQMGKLLEKLWGK